MPFKSNPLLCTTVRTRRVLHRLARHITYNLSPMQQHLVPGGEQGGERPEAAAPRQETGQARDRVAIAAGGMSGRARRQSRRSQDLHEVSLEGAHHSSVVLRKGRAGGLMQELANVVGNRT
jgi:hypothetical protein